MSNVVKVLKAEIARISKKEAKSATEAIGKSNAWLRKTVADLNRSIHSLQKWLLRHWLKKHSSQSGY